MTHLFIPWPVGDSEREGALRDSMGRSCYTCHGGVAGAGHRGIVLKVRRADLSVTSARPTDSGGATVKVYKGSATFDNK